MDVFKRLLQLARPHLPKFLLALGCMIVVGVTTSALAFLVKPALDEIFLKKNSQMLYWIPLAVVLIYLLKGLCSYGQTVLMNFIGLRIIADVRNLLYRRIQMQSMSFFTRHPTGVLMSRITNDVGTIQGAVSDAVTSLFKDSVTLVSLICVIFYRDWKLALVAMIIFPVVVYPVAMFGRKMRQISRRSQVTMGSLNTLLHETISGARIVKAFGMEAYENRRFAEENERFFRLNIKAVSVNAASSPFMEFLGGIVSPPSFCMAGIRSFRGYPRRDLFFLSHGLIMLYEPIKRLTNVNNTIQQGIAGAQRVFEIIDHETEIQNRPGAHTLTEVTSGIHIQGVTFDYEKEPVLENINLFITAGEVVAFVGMSGGGKTTLVSLIPRFYDVTKGRICIDGRDIRDITIESLRAQIGMVTQQPILFNDTVRNIIAYGDIQRTDEEIFQAAKSANAHDFIVQLPEGYDTVIGEQNFPAGNGSGSPLPVPF
jgi:subfamily B ATP-binding cassette protein MsbA